MIHDATNAYSTGKEFALFFSLLAPTLHRKNGLPGAGRPFWAAETGRMRLLRQSSSGRRRELPTTQIVTIKPQMKSIEIHLKSHVVFFSITCPIKKVGKGGLGFGTTVVRQLYVALATWRGQTPKCQSLWHISRDFSIPNKSKKMSWNVQTHIFNPLHKSPCNPCNSETTTSAHKGN